MKPAGSSLIRSVVLLVALMTFSTAAQAWDLSKRLGLGLIQGSTDVIGTPALSAKYNQSQVLAYSAVLGINTGTNALMAGGRIFRNAFAEDYMNFYLVFGGYLVNKLDAITAKLNSGYQFEVLLGGEFRLPNLENLGLSFEAGIALTQLGGSVSIRTAGSSFVNAGMHYYF